MARNPRFWLVGILGGLLSASVTWSFSLPQDIPTTHRSVLRTCGKQQSVAVNFAPAWKLYRKGRSHQFPLLASGDTESTGQENTSLRGRIRKWKKRISKFTKSFLFAVAVLAARNRPAEAKYAHEIQEDRKYSIRPGATHEQASKLIEGEVPDDIPESKSVFDTKSSEVEESHSPTKTKSTYDYGDEDDEEDDYFDFEDSADRTRKAQSMTKKSGKTQTGNLQSMTRSQFSGIDTTKTKSRSLYIKVSVGLFIPTWGAMGVREFFRRRKEEAYVQKGLEILEAQKAEYFNITESNPDIEEGDEDDDDDDDDDDDGDDDDDDDDDEPDRPPPASRKGPKRPSGGGGSDGSNGDSDGDPGYGRPSEDDLKRLGDLFDKS